MVEYMNVNIADDDDDDDDEYTSPFGPVGCGRLFRQWGEMPKYTTARSLPS
jgi:hypothetical protein